MRQIVLIAQSPWRHFDRIWTNCVVTFNHFKQERMFALKTRIPKCFGAKNPFFVRNSPKGPKWVKRVKMAKDRSIGYLGSIQEPEWAWYTAEGPKLTALECWSVEQTLSPIPNFFPISYSCLHAAVPTFSGVGPSQQSCCQCHFLQSTLWSRTHKASLSQDNRRVAHQKFWALLVSASIFHKILNHIERWFIIPKYQKKIQLVQSLEFHEILYFLWVTT